MSERVRVSREGSIAVVTLDYSSRLNVLDRSGWEALATAVRGAAEDSAVRCILIRGAGSQAFSAGSDISVFPTQRLEREDVRSYGAVIESALTAISDCPVPTVAMIEGVCVGGGVEIAACCDLRICGASSRFGAPINRLGLTMSHAELRPLVRAVGPSAALEILLEGAIFGAVRAREMGLVNRVVPDAELEAEALNSARRIAAGAPLVNRWHKKFVRRLADPTPLSEEEIAEGYAAFDTEDYRTGVTAFLEKEDPEFEGR